MSGHGGGDPLKVIRAALYANLAIAACKFVAAYLSNSTATLAEAVHSLADTGNQGLLFTGVVLAGRRDNRYAFGRAAERYFWPFVVALLLFSVGGAFAVYEGVHKVFSPDAPDLTDFWSLRHGPLTSLLVLGLSVLTKSGLPDAIGSIVIGLLLMFVAVLIARDTHSLLIGERATPEMERTALDLTLRTEGVRKVTQLLTMHLGPDFIVLAMKVAFAPDMQVARVEEVINEVERRIRAEMPSMKKIFIEPDSHGDGRGLDEEAA
jgi:divalent metal cation (Fe/Co/Zn/Cd) transporter